MDETVEHTAPQAPCLGVESAAALRGNARRSEAARRFVTPDGNSGGLDRWAELAARLLGAPSARSPC